jgi:hypothetical protein
MSDDLMLKWYDYFFVSSTRNTPDFDAFADDLKSYVRRELPDCDVIFNKGHFFCAIFLVQNCDRHFYIEIPDVRYNRWAISVKFRQVDYVADWIGGENRYCCIGDIGTIPIRLFG